MLQTKTFHFCPMCGTQYPPDQWPIFDKHCSACEYTFHENQRIAVGGVIIQDGKVLFVRRAVEPQQGKLDIPGGFVEPIEHPEEAMLRELKEELGVEGEIVKLLGLFSPNPYLYKGKINYTCDAFYQLKVHSTDFTPQDDVASIEWFSLDELPVTEEIAFPTTQKLVEDLKIKNLELGI